MGITRARLHLPSPALIIACLALFAALGGTTYAAASSSSGSIHFTKAKLKNGWANFGGVFAPAGYAKDSSGIVHLRGGVTGGSDGATAFVLPSGMRPKHNLDLPVYTQSTNFGGVDIHSNGDVDPFGGQAGSFTSLDGISFAAGE